MTELIALDKRELENLVEEKIKEYSKTISLVKPDRFLTLEEASQMLRVNRKTVSVWIKQGKLKAQSVEGGRNILIRESDINKILVTY